MLHRRLYGLLMLALFCCLYGYVDAQHILQGQISSAEKKSVVNASIKIKDSAKGAPRFFAISDINGNYRITLPLDKKKVWVECSLLGYRNVLFELSIGAELTTVRNIRLVADTAELPNINIYSIPPVTVSGDTTTFRVEAFKKGNESNVGELLNAVPGFTVNNGLISYNGKAVTKVLVEDDDLFGSDYNTVTQNMSPKGIEKIQLIQNYNDKTYLSNRMKKGNELVINLKFNKKYLYRVITSNEAGMSVAPVAGFYKVRQNIVSLIPRLKSVTTTNFNNTGLLATEVLGTNFNTPELAAYKKDAISFDLFPGFYAAPVDLVPDISSPIVPKNKTVDNHTSIITSNTLFKPSTHAQFRTVIQYYRDLFSQNQSQATDYSPSGINLHVQSNQYLRKEIPFINALIETVLSPSQRSQLVYKASFSNRRETDSLTDTRQSVEMHTTDNVNTTRFQQQLGYSFAIDSSCIMDLRGMHFSESSRRSPLLSPAGIYSFFTQDSISDQLASSMHIDNIEYGFQAKVTKRYRKSNWSAELLYSESRAGLVSDITMIDQGAETKPASVLLFNDAGLKTSISAAIFSYNLSLSRKIQLHTTQRIETGRLVFNDARHEENKAYTNYLPSASFSFDIARNHQISLNFDTRNRLPQIYNLTEGYFFAGAGQVTKGNGEIRNGVSKSLSLTYSFAEMIKSKMTAYLLIYYSREPLLYLADISPSVYYTLRNTVLMQKNMTILSANAVASKYVRGIKSQLGLEVRGNKLSNFYSANAIPGTITYYLLNTTVKCKTLITDKLTTLFSANHLLMKQQTNKGLVTGSNNTSNTFTATAQCSYRFNSKWILSATEKYIHQSQAGRNYSLHLGEFSMKYTPIKDKLYVTLSGNNLFNKSRFTALSLTQYSVNTQSVGMVRSYWMLGVGLEL